MRGVLPPSTPRIAIVIAFLALLSLGQAADSIRATAEWALRQGGRIRLAGLATPLADLSARSGSDTLRLLEQLKS